MKNTKILFPKETEKLINKIISLLKGKTVKETTDILFRTMDKIKSQTSV